MNKKRQTAATRSAARKKEGGKAAPSSKTSEGGTPRRRAGGSGSTSRGSSGGSSRSSTNPASSSSGGSNSRSSSRGASSLEARLRRIVSTVDVAHALTMPLIRSVENLLYLAARALGSSDASVLVRDGDEGGLRFLVAIGAVADKLLEVRIPPGKGIAGFVYASGQPMVVADVQRESAFYPEIDRLTGYSTQTILATPLQVAGETIGVLEFVNRTGSPPFEPFSPNEMDWAARFADAIATLVDSHETAGLIEMLFERAVQEATADADEAEADEAEAATSSGGGSSRGGSAKGTARGRVGTAGAPRVEAENLQQWLAQVRAAPEHREMLALAVSLSEVAGRGKTERRLCRDILDAVARWTDERRDAPGTRYFQSST